MAPSGQTTDLNFRDINLIDRRPRKQRSKKGIAYDNYVCMRKKGQHPCCSKRQATFQKKIVVVKYMGSNPPKQFTPKENLVAMRGLLPDISSNASQEEVQSEVVSVIVSFDDELAVRDSVSDCEFR